MDDFELFSQMLSAAMRPIQVDSSDFKEIRRLDNMLMEADIPHLFKPHMCGGFHLVYYGKKGKPQAKPGQFMGDGIGAVCSVIETPSSYGHEKDLIEISGLLTEEEAKFDSVAGGLTAEDVFNRIKKHWEEDNKVSD